jgi:hypothetical protein
LEGGIVFSHKPLTSTHINSIGLSSNFRQKKAVLQNYLTQHSIPFSATDTKKVLYEKIKQRKTPVVYKTDKIANLHGHEVLRTPVQHCELNPIELSIDFQTTQERQHYSSPGDSHHPLIWPETLNRNRQSNPHFAYLHAK